jgi:hypothetical protein
MKTILLSVILVLAIANGYSQVTDAEKQLKTQVKDTVMGWKKGGVININTSQTSLTNWAAGGQSSVSVNGLLSLHAHNKKEKSLWENYLDLGYGSLKQKGGNWWKTDDRIDLTSKYGLKAAQNLYYAALLNFKTQMAPGFNYPNDSVKISDFLAPGYLLLALGIDYVPGKNFTVYFAPFTYKLTMVNDDVLADAGAFGVEPGNHSKSEFGGYLRTSLQKDLMENVTLQTKLDLFSNYLKNFGNIDVSWEILLSLKVNKFISATISTHLLYDHDITLKKDRKDGGDPDDYSSKIQFKDVLAGGLSLKF